MYHVIHPKAIRALTCPQYLNRSSLEQLIPPPTDSVRAADAVSQSAHVMNKLVYTESGQKSDKTNNAQDDIRQDAGGDGVSCEEEEQYEEGGQKYCPCGNEEEVSHSISLSQVSIVVVVVETRNQPTRDCELFSNILSVDE